MSKLTGGFHNSLDLFLQFKKQKARFINLLAGKRDQVGFLVICLVAEFYRNFWFGGEVVLYSVWKAS